MLTELKLKTKAQLMLSTGEIFRKGVVRVFPSNCDVVKLVKAKYPTHFEITDGVQTIPCPENWEGSQTDVLYGYVSSVGKIQKPSNDRAYLTKLFKEAIKDGLITVQKQGAKAKSEEVKELEEENIELKNQVSELNTKFVVYTEQMAKMQKQIEMLSKK